MENDIILDINSDMAIDIVTNNISELTKMYSITKDENESKQLQEKINLLNKLKDEIYLGNKEIINKVIEKNKKGML